MADKYRNLLQLVIPTALAFTLVLLIPGYRRLLAQSTAGVNDKLDPIKKAKDEVDAANSRIDAKYAELENLAEKSAAHEASILDGVTFRARIVHWTEEGIDVSLNVAYDKDGKDKIVDAVFNTTVVYVNDRPWAVIRDTSRTHRIKFRVKPNTRVTFNRSVKGVFKLGDKVAFEWTNMNPRTNMEEKIRSDETIVTAELAGGTTRPAKD